VLISRAPLTWETLSNMVRVGTASLRRAALVRQHRPHAQLTPLRGNVQTRLKKLHDENLDATLLAYAGLKRLALMPEHMCILETSQMLPAVGQGAIALVCRISDTATQERVQQIACRKTETSVTCERAFLRVLEGSCRTPIAGYAQVLSYSKPKQHEILSFQGLYIKPDTGVLFEVSRIGVLEDAQRMGADAGLELRIKAGLEKG
jgi:hydroxymethylbilane synthase